MLPFLQAPKTALGEHKPTISGPVPNLCLGLPATINITLGVADAHKRGG